MLKLIVLCVIFSCAFSRDPYRYFKSENKYQLDDYQPVHRFDLQEPPVYPIAAQVQKDEHTKKLVIKPKTKISRRKHQKSEYSSVEVCAKAGCILGKYESGRLRPYDAFYGIPYAEPPVGKLRFENPVPYRGWKGYWNATYPRSDCAQRNSFIYTQPIVGSEDCLYLNVYRPKMTFAKKLLPVMIWIHGGALISGSSSPEQYGPEYLMDNGEVILVTLNYRLGLFGFLCSGDEAVKGNFGLKDQQLALKWVSANIEAFGGDPHSITLFGQSAGGMSTHLHMMNPVSQKLFHRVILMSGTAIASWGFTSPSDWKYIFRKSARYIGLAGWDSLSTYELTNSLKKMEDIKLILALDQLSITTFAPPVPVGPCIEGDWEGAFLKEDPRKVWAEGRYVKKPILIGTTSDEGVFVASLTHNPTRLKTFNENIYDILPIQLNINSKFDKEVLDFYLKKDYVDESNVRSYYQMLTDRLFLYPVIKTVKQYLKHASDINQNPIYIYEFGFRSKYTFLQVLTGMDINLGVTHIDDLLYIFTMSAYFPLFDPKSPEGVMVNTFVKTLVNFAVKGEVKTWTPFNQCTLDTNEPYCDRQIFRRYNNTNPNAVIVSVSNKINERMVKFWDHIGYK